MVISRSQMTKQLEPGLGNSWRGKQKKKASAIYVKKTKSHSKKSK
jgi:hypothetical protein